MKCAISYFWPFAVVAVLGGCSSLGIPSPWGYNYDDPPTKASTDATYMVSSPKRTVIVIGRFDNPKVSPIEWKDIGAGMSDALSRTLLNDHRFDVRINDALATRISVFRRPTEGSMSSLFKEAKRTYKDIDFVITGRVTDFHHTSELPEEASKRGWFAPDNHAIVAIELNIVDMRSGRVAVADHVFGTAKASDLPVKEFYKGLSFGSYLFWNTPLGKASKEAIHKTVERLVAVVPSKVQEVAVLRQIGWRELSLNGGTDHGIKTGQRYYICVRDAATGKLRPVKDKSLGSDMEAQITKTEKRRSTAWIMGEAEPGVYIGNAVLTRELPVSEESADTIANADSD